MELIFRPHSRESRDLRLAPTLQAEGRQLAGYAAVFYDAANPDTEYRYNVPRPGGKEWIEIRERIMPGAFDIALIEDDCRGMYNHRQLLGRRKPGREVNTLSLSVDARGLLYAVDLAETTSGRDVKLSLERGDLDGSSFVFTVREGGVTARQEGDHIVRELRSLYLHDVSAVDYPAYEATTAELRSIDPGDVLRLLQSPTSGDGRSLTDLNAMFQSLQGLESRGSDQLSQDEIRYQLAKLLQARLGGYAWPCEVYDSYFIYDMGDPPRLWQQGYTVTGLEVSLVGEATPVDRITTYQPR